MKSETNTILDNSRPELAAQGYWMRALGGGDYTRVRVLTSGIDLDGLELLGEALSEWLLRPECSSEVLLQSRPLPPGQASEGAELPQTRLLGDLSSSRSTASRARLCELLSSALMAGRLRLRVLAPDARQRPAAMGLNVTLFSNEDEGVASALIGSSELTAAGLSGAGQLNWLEAVDGTCLSPAARRCLSPAALFNALWPAAADWGPTLTAALHDKFGAVWQSDAWRNGAADHVAVPAPGNATASPSATAPTGSSDTGAATASRPTALRTAQTQDLATDPLTPRELYEKLLLRKLEAVVAPERLLPLVEGLPGSATLQPWQAEVALECLLAARETGGFVLAHVVGTPRTLLAALVCKAYSGENAAAQAAQGDLAQSPLGRANTVLVVTTEAQRGQWLETLTALDREGAGRLRARVDVACLEGHLKPQPGDLLSDFDFDDPARQEAQPMRFDAPLPDRDYGLVLVDEAHLLADSRTPAYQTLLEKIDALWMRTGLRPWVGLLGARVNEMTNEEQAALRALMPSGSFTTVQRSVCDARALGLAIPAFAGADPMEYPLDEERAALWLDTVAMFAEEANNHSSSAPSGHAETSGNHVGLWTVLAPCLLRSATEEERATARRDARLVRLDLLRRLQSGTNAFRTQLHRLLLATDRRIAEWEADAIFLCPDLDTATELDPKKNLGKIGRQYAFSECCEHLRAKLRALGQRNPGGRNRELRQADFEARYIELLHNDQKLLRKLDTAWSAADDDPKLSTLVETIRLEVAQRTGGQTAPMVIYTDYPETQLALREALETACPEARALCVGVKNRKVREQTLRENFDSLWRGAAKSDYNVLLSTDVLGESVGLGRCEMVVCYDRAWNATRLQERLCRSVCPGAAVGHFRVWQLVPRGEGDEASALLHTAQERLCGARRRAGYDVGYWSLEAERAREATAQLVEGLLSPLAAHLATTRALLQEAPERLARLRQDNQGAELAAEAQEQTAYFVVGRDRSRDLYVQVDDQLHSQLLDLPAALDAFRTESLCPGPLPDDYREQRGTALLAAREAYQTLDQAALHTPAGESLASEAKGVIAQMERTSGLSRDTRRLLTAARNLVDRGSHVMMLRLREMAHLTGPQGARLFDVSEQQFEQTVRHEIESIVEAGSQPRGEADVLMAMSR